MVGEVNKIIFNMLISGQGVYLPEIGTLYIERKGAKKVAEKLFGKKQRQRKNKGNLFRIPFSVTS